MYRTSQNQVSQSDTIAFVARCSYEETQQWLLHLSQTVQHELILPFAEMTEIDKFAL